MNLLPYHLFLLDVMMEGMSGFALAKELKANQSTASIPIIFLTAKDTENDMVTGFNIGADDYISKPFSIREVMVRVRAVLRRTKSANTPNNTNTIEYKGLKLNANTKTVSVDGKDIAFTKTEYELLKLLLEAKGRVLSRQELIDKVWPSDVLVLDRTVDVNITRLRKKIGNYANNIVTRQGFGYYFDA
jgi:DNA-binding response OmpR family regulator